jgi:hypothetical protein
VLEAEVADQQMFVVVSATIALRLVRAQDSRRSQDVRTDTHVGSKAHALLLVKAVQDMVRILYQRKPGS